MTAEQIAEQYVEVLAALGWDVCVTDSEHDPRCGGDPTDCARWCPVPVQRWLTDEEAADALAAALPGPEQADDAFAKMRDAFKREHQWRRETEAQRDDLRAKVARVEALTDAEGTLVLDVYRRAGPAEPDPLDVMRAVERILADRLAAERERWEAAVLWEFVGAMPAEGEAPDFIAVLCDAVLGARAPA